MRPPLKDAGHLIRLGLVFFAGLATFLVVRGFVIPPSFGQYGHYRGASIEEIAARPVVFAGHAVCAGCHQEVVDFKKTGKHVQVNCESCHGPQARHAEDPLVVVPKKLDTAVLCVQCHEANAAKPRSFPQVDPKEHSGGVACGGCHQPHRPSIGR